MESSTEGYHISFFKPTTERARYNRNMVVWLVSIWFIAIFGFQIILKIAGKPVPEAAYTSFEKAWSSIEKGNHTENDLKELAKSCLSVLGKIEVTPEAELVLKDVFNWCLYKLTPEPTQPALIDEIVNFKKVSATISTLEDKQYNQLKSALSVKVSPLLDLTQYDARKKVIPFALESESMGDVNTETKRDLPVLMGKYLIHNQSFLTDFKFLGFPFHYFYTAVFLLILFVGLCWIYCVKIDSVNKKLEIAD